MEKTLIARLVNEHADRLALKLRNWDALEATLNKNFDATADDKGNVTIVRKGTQQVIGDSFETFFKLVARHHVDDKSFGAFRSQFKPRTPSTEEKSMAKALLDNSRFHFTDQAKREKIEGFILSNFVPDGKDLRKLGANGMVSTKSYAPDEIMMQYGREIIDPDRSELLRLEALAEIRDRSQWLAGNDGPTAERVFSILQKVNAPVAKPLPSDLLEKQNKDTEARAMAALGILDKSSATLAELNQIAIKQKQFIAELDMLPVKPSDL